MTLPVRDALAQLPVRAEDRTGYERRRRDKPHRQVRLSFRG
ncbi:hypothetical protein [Streptomyces sp. NPDC058964]